MNATVQIKDGYYQIKIPVQEAYDNDNIRELLDLLRVEKILSKSEATDEFVKELSDEVKKSWWEKNKHRVIK